MTKIQDLNRWNGSSRNWNSSIWKNINAASVPNCHWMKCSNVAMDASSAPRAIPSFIRVSVLYAGFPWIGTSQSGVEWLKVHYPSYLHILVQCGCFQSFWAVICGHCDIVHQSETLSLRVVTCRHDQCGKSMEFTKLKVQCNTPSIYRLHNFYSFTFSVKCCLETL